MFYRISPGGVPFYVFSQLERIPGLVHAFTGRETDAAAEGNGDAAQWAASKPHLLKSLGLRPDQALQLRQLHSARIVAFSQLDGRPEGDGLLVTQPGCFALIKTADCLPVALIDPESRCLCLVHAGWRGTADGAVQAALERLLEAAQAEPQKLVAALGPCIRCCCYEVGPEVRQQFEEKGHPVDRIFRQRQLDLVEANRTQLEALGVGTILDSGQCTSCRADLFYSWRKKRDHGRMWALAGFAD